PLASRFSPPRRGKTPPKITRANPRTCPHARGTMPVITPPGGGGWHLLTGRRGRLSSLNAKRRTRRMRNRSLFGFAATLCVFAVAAAPALGAKEFKATEVGKEFAPGETGKEKGAGTEIQDFKFGAFHILCEGAKAKGRVDFTMSKTLFLSVRYKPCYALAKLSGQT